MALGGGCEILLHCAAVQAHAETYMGLVEVGVGVIPGWGGCKEMLARWVDQPDSAPAGRCRRSPRCSRSSRTAKVAKSADEARELLFLRPADGITMNRDRLLADAKARALALVAAGYTPPEPAEHRAARPDAAGRRSSMAVDGFRAAAARRRRTTSWSPSALAEVLTGGDTDLTETVTEDDLSRLERAGLHATWSATPRTLARIEHMLETGKPLRN